MLAFVDDPLTIDGLTRAAIRGLVVRIVWTKTFAGEEHIGVLAVVLGEQKLPLGIRRPGLTRFLAVLLENRNGAQRRCMVIRRKCAGAFTDEEDHGVAFLDVGGELFKERCGTLAEMLLVADFKLLASQHPRDFAATGFQLAADGGDENPKFSRCWHRSAFAKVSVRAQPGAKQVQLRVAYGIQTRSRKSLLRRRASPYFARRGPGYAI